MHSKGIGRSLSGNMGHPNEDAMYLNDALGLYIVSDGIGGQPCGEIASATTVRALVGYLEGNRAQLNEIIAGVSPVETAIRICEEAIRYASREVYASSFRDRKTSGMGSTVTMLLMLGSNAVMAHVGNTRLYLFRKSLVYQISRDHTLKAEYIYRGLGREADSLDKNLCNMLTQSLGTHQSPMIDTLLVDLLPDDRLLLCTNGLSKGVKSFEKLARILAGEFDKTAQNLVDYAITQEENDDITAVVVKPSQRLTDKHNIVPTYLPLDRYFDVLNDIQLFEDLSLRQLQRVVNLSRIERYDGSEIVAKEGEPCPGLIIVLDGFLEVSRNGEDLDVLASGDTAEETALFSDRLNRTTYEALIPSRVLILEREKFQFFTKQHPRIAVALLNRLSMQIADELEEYEEEQCQDDSSDALSIA